MAISSGDFTPYTPQELWDEFHRPGGSINKHLPVIYSLAAGLNAKRALDLGIGSTTRTLRAAMAQTGGKIHSCDIDRARFEPLLSESYPDWEIHLCDSETFLRRMEPPFDFCMHDAAHDYAQTKADLSLIFPMMRQFALVCVHDTQHEECGREMTAALHEAARDYKVSYTHLPYCYGLTILRMEESVHPPSLPSWNKGEGWPETKCFPDAAGAASAKTLLTGRVKGALRAAKRKLTK